ncbi:MAG: hypothetical protein KC713_06800 [Candidatus Omnitrophica bacterium]|nr:hypothetical protein [Candidatus Omnitrophota bacterium]
MKKTITFILAAAVVYVVSANSQAASITGTVTYDGQVPKLREIKMDADPICLGLHGDSAVYPQILELGEGNTMANIFVHVTGGLPKKDFPAPTEPAELTQAGCMYDPHVLGVMVGQPVKILNPDGTLHNVHAIAKENEEFNIAMPKFRKEITRTFDKPEFMLQMKCDVHPWMGAFISVMEHPFFSVTQKDGVYAINDLPAGSYEIEAWHEKLGTQKMKVELAEGESKEINFTFSRPGK